jgi:hypothetical protein
MVGESATRNSRPQHSRRFNLIILKNLARIVERPHDDGNGQDHSVEAGAARSPQRPAASIWSPFASEK